FMKDHFRFSLFAFACIWLATTMSLCAAAQTIATNTRPNILFCLADDQSWPHAGVYGDKTIHTPTQDRVARNGMRFNYCFSTAPTCSASRAAILTGQYPHRLKEGANLWGTLDKRFPVYPDLLERAGYVVGFTRKGWGPGNFKAGGRARNPAGPEFKDFASFIATVPADKPFCFWFGSHQPHRPYKKGLGLKTGLKPETVEVPPIWPDVPEVRGDILDYYAEVQIFDHDVGQILDMLEKAGRLTNTLVVLSGDNGWPFPRAKANLYDAGTRQPLIVQWPGRIKPGGVSDDFINLMDLAPTFLEAAGLQPLPEMTGRSFIGLLEGTEAAGSRNEVFFERERHANVRKGDLGYPMRAVRTRDFLYIRNFHPDRWPAGDPEMWKAVGPFGDVDPGPTKQYILDHRDDPGVARLFQLAFGKRPAEELYDVNLDPCQTNNLAGEPGRQQTLQQLRDRLDRWMKDTADPRTGPDDGFWDRAAYYGPPP
ncbi:MAG TPA: sulfatase, partial [Verrucomicrobiae bacterium]|nr:sulfatase [Verrucomicrobiae bacterium]